MTYGHFSFSSCIMCRTGIRFSPYCTNGIVKSKRIQVGNESGIFNFLQVEEKFVSVQSKLQEGLMDHLYFSIQ
ncbi:hypothetical protein LXL04_017739 [Taraxacum kok-saghyz]